jgi:hypothetical protein
MSIETISDIIGSISLLIIAIFVCVAFYYLIKILGDISKITRQAREKSEKFGDLISTLITMVKKRSRKAKRENKNNN